MELVNRYIQAVQSYLPLEMQQELAREISAHLYDELDHQAQLLGRPLHAADIEQVLQQWGHPRQVALQYAPPKPLVSSEWMPLYWQSLKFLLAALFVLQVLKISMILLQADYFKLLQFSLQLLFGFADDALMAFAAVTLFFYAASFSPQWQRWLGEGQWQLKDLPPVGRAWQRMSGSDLVTDIASSAFLLLLLWHPIWMSADALASLRVTWSAELLSWRPWLSGVLLLSLLMVIAWCWRPYWTRRTLLQNMVLNALLVPTFALLNQQEALLVATGQPLPSLLNVASVDQIARICCLLAAAYLSYELLRDARRYYLLRQVG